MKEEEKSTQKHFLQDVNVASYQEIEVYLIAIEDTRFNVGMTEAAKKGGDKVINLLIEEFK